MKLSVPGTYISISRSLVQITNKRNRKREWEVALLEERIKVLIKSHIHSCQSRTDKSSLLSK